MNVELETEEKILEAAQNVFHRRGLEGARMQEIADEAGINKSMLHYYYRNKDNLFMKVFQNGVKKIFPQIMMILSKDISLKEKTWEIVEFYHNTFKTNPHLPAFAIHEMNQNPERFREFVTGSGMKIPQQFQDQVKQEVRDGNIIPISSEQFLMNIISMTLMPMIAKNMVMVIHGFSEEDFEAFLDEREEMIPDLIFKGVSFFKGV